MYILESFNFDQSSTHHWRVFSQQPSSCTWIAFRPDIAQNPQDKCHDGTVRKQASALSLLTAMLTGNMDKNQRLSQRSSRVRNVHMVFLYVIRLFLIQVVNFSFDISIAAHLEDTYLAHSKLTRWALTVTLLWALCEFATHTMSLLWAICEITRWAHHAVVAKSSRC